MQLAGYSPRAPGASTSVSMSVARMRMSCRVEIGDLAPDARRRSYGAPRRSSSRPTRPADDGRLLALACAKGAATCRAEVIEMMGLAEEFGEVGRDRVDEAFPLGAVRSSR